MRREAAHDAGGTTAGARRGAPRWRQPATRLPLPGWSGSGRREASGAGGAAAEFGGPGPGLAVHCSMTAGPLSLSETDPTAQALSGEAAVKG
jgi:hypothetical protein